MNFDLAQLGGWLPIVIVAVLWTLRIVYLFVSTNFWRWTLRLDRRAWLRENGYDDLILEPEDRA